MRPVPSGIRRVPRVPARSRLLGVALLLAAGACEPPLGPPTPLPDHAVRFTAPPQYLEWWARTEACSGRRGNMEKIVWWVVPDAASIDGLSGGTIARWSLSTEGVRIIVAGNSLDHEMVIRHEMLHALLEVAEHPYAYFVERCGLTWTSWQGGPAPVDPPTSESSSSL